MWQSFQCKKPPAHLYSQHLKWLSRQTEENQFSATFKRYSSAPLFCLGLTKGREAKTQDTNLSLERAMLFSSQKANLPMSHTKLHHPRAKAAGRKSLPFSYHFYPFTSAEGLIDITLWQVVKRPLVGTTLHHWFRCCHGLV